MQKKDRVEVYIKILTKAGKMSGLDETKLNRLIFDSFREFLRVENEAVKRRVEQFERDSRIELTYTSKEFEEAQTDRP